MCRFVQYKINIYMIYFLCYVCNRVKRQMQLKHDVNLAHFVANQINNNENDKQASKQIQARETFSTISSSFMFIEFI